MGTVSKRYRVNVSTSVKGVKTYDCTVDITRSMDELEGGDFEDGYIKNEVLKESDKLVAELEQRYPIKLEDKNG